jgi:hypothetical protein
MPRLGERTVKERLRPSHREDCPRRRGILTSKVASFPEFPRDELAAIHLSDDTGFQGLR